MSSASSASSSDRSGARTPSSSAGVVDPDDPRTHISVGVLMANGRLAGRSFASYDEALAWAQPGEQVVEYNWLCECDR